MGGRSRRSIAAQPGLGRSCAIGASNSPACPQAVPVLTVNRSLDRHSRQRLRFPGIPPMERRRMRSGFRPRQQMQLPEPSPSLWRAISISLSIAVTLILLPAIAFASPPDPSWIAGIYDGADGDDIVSLVYETSGSNTAALSHMPLFPGLTDTSFESIVHCFPGGQSTRRPRSPPTIAPSRTFNSSTDYTATSSPSLTPAPAHPSASSVSPQEAT